MSKVKYDLVVIGAGGTGTYFLKEVSRFICDNKEFSSLTIFDGDTVEEKNLKRQSFIMEDIGRNKAAVMAEILNDSFDMRWKSEATYLNSLSQLPKPRRGVVPLIVSCVDNHGCRLLLEEYFKLSENCIYFDSANEFDTGEVVYAYKYDGNVAGKLRSELFPHIKEEDTRMREEMSCEELNQVAPQHIFTNMMAGHLLCVGVANLLGGTITPGLSMFNSLKMTCGFRGVSK